METKKEYTKMCGFSHLVKQHPLFASFNIQPFRSPLIAC